MSTRKERRAKPRFSQGQGTTSYIGIRGRKTGITAKEFVVRDVDNLENVDDFFESSEDSAQSDDDSFSFIRTFQHKYLPDASPQDHASPSTPPKKDVSSKKATPQTIEKTTTSFSPLQPVPFNLDIPAPDDEPEAEFEREHEHEQLDSVGQPEPIETKNKKEPKQKKQPKKRKPKVQATELDESPQDGHRRSKRTKIKPVEYWRNERVIYKFGDGLVPSVADVYHRPHTTPDPTTKQKKTRIEKEIPKVHMKTTKGKATKLLAKHKSMVDSKQRNKGKASVVQVFDEDAFVSGLFFLPPTSNSNQTAEQTEVFYVITGKVNVIVHKGEVITEEKEIELESGAHFFIPQGSEYTLVNPSKQQKCKLLFTSVK